MVAWLGALVALLLATEAAAEIALPPGFTAQVYLTGRGFDSSSERPVRGIPAASTLGFDYGGGLYLARLGARFRQGEVEDLTPIYRFPAGSATLTPDAEARFLHGPPLRNPQVAGVRRGEVFVTTYDRDRRIGALYRMKDGRPQLFAGGTPPPGSPPLLRHPEGVAFDGAGRVYVADREQGLVVRLDGSGTVLDQRYLTVPRARMLAIDEQDRLWIGGDGSAETPFQDGAGQIWRAGPDGDLTLVLQGPLPAGISLSPGGALFVAQRRTGKLFAITPEGKRIDFAHFTDETAIRGLAFAPVTAETRQAGIGGDLFVIAVPRRSWTVNEVIRISGRFDEFIRQPAQPATP